MNVSPKTKRHKAEDECYADYTLQAPDGGWGWMTLVGGVSINFLIPGLIKSFGVLFVDLLRVFEATPVEASWIPAVTFFIYLSLGPVASYLVGKFSCRVVTFTGGLLASLGMVLSFWADSISYLYFSYGVVGGIGAGLAYTPAIVIVGQYFDRLRGLANGLCVSGSAAGAMVMPNLLQYLLTEYGYRGAILIIGGVLLNTCVAASLFQPVEWHRKRVPRHDGVSVKAHEQPRGSGGMKKSASSASGFRFSSSCSPPEQGFNNDTKTEPLASEKDGTVGKNNNDSPSNLLTKSVENGCENSELTSESAPVTSYWKKPSSILQSITKKWTKSVPSKTKYELSQPGVSDTDPNLHKPVDGCAEQKLDENLPSVLINMDSELCSNCMSSSEKSVRATSDSPKSLSTRNSTINMSISPSHVQLQQQEGKESSTEPPKSGTTANSAASPKDTEASYLDTTTLLKQRLRDGQHSSSGTASIGRSSSVASVSSFHYINTIHHGSTLSVLQDSSHMLHDGCHKSSVHDDEQLEKIKLLDLSLLRNRLFLVIFLSYLTNSIGYVNLIILLPAYAGTQGFSDPDGAFLLSIVAGLDLVGRIGGSTLSDTHIIPRRYIFIIGITLSGIAICFLPLMSSYTSLATCCAIIGLFSGTYIGLMAAILADELGQERLGSSFGLYVAGAGMCSLCGPPIFGLLLEYLGQFELLFFIQGLFLTMGGGIWVLYPSAVRKEINKTSQVTM